MRNNTSWLKYTSCKYNSCRGAMSKLQRFMYNLLTLLGQFLRLACFNTNLTNIPNANRKGGYILAITHMGNIEPAIVSCIVKRKIRWMARKSYFNPFWSRTILQSVGGFPVNRFGIATSAIRTSINAVNSGEVVGIFPEGGVKKEAQAVIHGGEIKRGVCVIAQRTQKPVVPIVILGTTKLNKVSPWLPFKNATITMACGKPITVNAKLPRREGRFEMSTRLENEFVNTYKNILKLDKSAEQFYHPETKA